MKADILPVKKNRTATLKKVSDCPSGGSADDSCLRFYGFAFVFLKSVDNRSLTYIGFISGHLIKGSLYIILSRYYICYLSI